MTSAADIAASIEAKARDIFLAMQTYQRCPQGGRVRQDLIASVEVQYERLGHLLACLTRKDGEER
jgi:hypothetical protein